MTLEPEIVTSDVDRPDPVDQDRTVHMGYLPDVLRGLGITGGMFSGLPSFGLGDEGGGVGGVAIRAPMRQEPWIFASVDLFHIAASMMRMRIHDRSPEDDGAQEILGGPLYDLFQSVNPCQSPSDLRVSDGQNELLTGESFWALERNGAAVRTIGDGPDARIELPDQIWSVPGTLVREKLDKEKRVPLWWTMPISRSGSGRWVDFPSGSVVQFKHAPDPARYCRGMGPLAAAFGPAAQSHLARRYLNRLLQNDGRISGIVVVGGTLRPGERRRMEAELEDDWDNPENAGRTRILEGDAKYHEGAAKPRDMEWGGLLDANRKEISACFSTPDALLGLGTTNFATFIGEFRRYLFLRVEPWARKRADTINLSFISRLRDPGLSRLRVDFDTSPLWRMVEDLAAQAKQMSDLVRSGVPVDVAARKAGLAIDPIDGGDVSMVNQAMVAMIDAQARGRALRLKAQADAASALQLAGVAGQDALRLAEIPAKFQEPEEPEIVEDEEEEGDEPIEEDEEAIAASLNGSTRQTRDPAAGFLETPEEREDAIRGHQSVLRRNANKMSRGLKNVLGQMRAAQLAALEQYAAHGFVAREGPPVRLYAERAPEDLDLAGLLAAWRADEAERATIPAEDLTEFRSCRCTGELETVQIDHRPRQEAWLRDVPDAARLGLRRLRDLALCQSLRITEQEIDDLLVAGEARWAEALAGKLTPTAQLAYLEAAQQLASEVGISAISATPPSVLEAIAARSIKVAEGTQSVLARRLRRTFLEILSADPAANLHAAVKNLLGELKATTTRAFRSHSARALTIARTEVGGATNSARYEELRRSFAEGIIKGIMWLVGGSRSPAPGGTVRASHWALERVVSTPGVPFVSPISGASALHPSGFGVASEDIACNCGLVGVPADAPTE